MDLVHPVPYSAIVFAIAGAVLLFGRRRWFARRMSESDWNNSRHASPLPPTPRRVPVCRHQPAGPAVIAYLTA